MNFNNKYFYTFEGGEGSGKSTMASAVSEILKEKGYNVIITREPGGFDNKISEDIRSLIMNNESISPMTEFLLFSSSRVEHLSKTIIPAISKKTIVISDRFADSSIVYQGYAKEMGMEKLIELTNGIIDNAWPLKTFYFKLEASKGLERINNNRRNQTNRFDFNDISFHEKVSQGYDILSNIFKDRFMTINANDTIEKNSKIISDEIIKNIEGNNG